MSRPKTPASAAILLRPYTRQPMAVASTAQASARVTGVANSNEKTTPSGVSMLREDARGSFMRGARGQGRGARSFAARPTQEEAKRRQFADAGCDLERVGNHGLVVLRN